MSNTQRDESPDEEEVFPFVINSVSSGFGPGKREEAQIRQGEQKPNQEGVLRLSIGFSLGYTAESNTPIKPAGGVADHRRRNKAITGQRLINLLSLLGFTCVCIC